MRSIGLLSAAVLGLSLSLSAAQAADTGPSWPRPKPDCSRKNKSNCMRDAAHDQAVYASAYWLAKSGRHAEALDVLAKARNQSDPRILNYVGFNTRKLGRVDEALGYYQRALAIDPDYTVARAYMGEAFLQKGEPTKAREQLAEIARRCGTTCSEHAELAGEIARFEAGRG